MKKILLVCTALLALSATAAAAADIQVAWNDCKIDGGAASKTSACTSDGGLAGRLVVSYTPTASIPDFVAIDGTIDLQDDIGPMPPWWDLKNVGACRQTAASIGINVFNLPNSFTCADTWDGGASATGLFTGYALGYGAPDRARAVFAIARGASNPTAIAQGTNYFGWYWQIINVNTSSCAGCSDPVAIWSPTMTLSGVSSVAPVVLSASPDDGESCVSWNGGSCNATPTQATTWGKVKAMYR